MEFKCNYYHDLFGGKTCDVVKIVKTGDVKRFRIMYQKLEAFPRNLREKFPNMTTLVIEGCGLKKISKTDLVGLDDLEELHLSGNELTSLPDDLFTDMRKLKIINFNHNSLKSLSSKLLKPIETTLEYAWFERNTKIDDFYNRDRANRNDLKRLMDIMDSLEPPLPDTGPQLYTEPAASGEYTDITITVRGKEFILHKNILATLSTKRGQIFLQDDPDTEKTFKEESAVIEVFLTKVVNFSHESFQNFLNFFDSFKVEDEGNALELFELATVFEVAILIEICADKIAATLSTENALEVYNLAIHHNSDELKGPAFKVIQKMFPDLPDKMVDKPEQVNKIMAAKREFDKIVNEAVNQLKEAPFASAPQTFYHVLTPNLFIPPAKNMSPSMNYRRRGCLKMSERLQRFHRNP